MIKYIEGPGGRMKLIVLHYGNGPGILWIHGGGYATGMPAMVYYSIGRLLAKRFGGTVVSPDYRKSRTARYPAAFEDCCAALEYMYSHADELGFDGQRIIVGGESAGGGLAAAVCLYARDRGDIPVAFQLPLYPMLDCEDTPSSRDNHGRNWNTKRNHRAWKLYLGDLYGRSGVPGYASPAHAEDYRGLPPCYTYVEDGEPFYDETLTYVRRLTEAGIDARADVYHGKTHGFDGLLWTRNATRARRKLMEEADRLMKG